ncbi:hypothetical protein BB560_006842, partial [Smittium megazygosporum]
MQPFSEKKLLKLEKQYKNLLKLNEQLTEECNRPKIPASEACAALISFVINTPDPLLPSVSKELQFADPFEEKKESGCCT